jgi:chromosome partitioning protein
MQKSVFFDGLSRTMAMVHSRVQRDTTLGSRVTKRFTSREVAGLLGLDPQYLVTALAKASEEDPNFPEGRRSGRERTFDPAELMYIRAWMHSKQTSKRPYLHWRQPGDPLRVVTFGSQKGGTGKSLSAAHFAQYMSMNYGLRVGVIDCDPQATVSLYFADEDLLLGRDPVEDPETGMLVMREPVRTVASFMGVESGSDIVPDRATSEMNEMWLPTPWPGVRLIPGGPDIQNGDLALLKAQRDMPIHDILKSQIKRWDGDFGPRTLISDLRHADGSFDAERFEAAMYETLDLIVIDQQPSLTLMQLNGILAATSIIVPQTLKGFDLSTLTTYAGSVSDYLAFAEASHGGTDLENGRHVVLPTIVQEANQQDLKQLVDLRSHAPEIFLDVWYARSDAVANASEEYKSIYEYDPPKPRRASAEAFTQNANVVNDRLAQVVWPELPDRGHAAKFIQERW